MQIDSTNCISLVLNKFTFIKQRGDALTFSTTSFYMLKVPLLQKRYAAYANTAAIYIILLLLLCISQCTSADRVANMA